MQENLPQPITQFPPSDDEEAESPKVPQTIANSPPNSVQIAEESTGSPRNGHQVTIVGGSRLSTGGSVGVGPDSGHSQPGFGLKRGSSADSLPDSNAYPVPIKYRSSVGSFEEHIACGFAALYSSAELSDVTIACEGKLLKAHKLVLALSSPYFRQIFEELNDIPCQHPVVILHGVKIKDWENIMRLIYHGIVHVNSNDIDDFISTAECLRVDGAFAEDPNSSHEDATPPYEYLSRFSGPEFQSPEESGQLHFHEKYLTEQSKSRQFSYSPEYLSTTPKDYRYETVTSPDPTDLSPRGENDQPQLPRYRKHSTPPILGTTRVISSAQSSPGISTQLGNRESILKVETHGETYGPREDSSSRRDVQRPPSCPELPQGFRAFSHSASPAESRTQAVRYPVISRRRETSGGSVEENFDVPLHATEYASQRVIQRHSRTSSYPAGWDARSLASGGDAAVIEEEHQQPFPSVISGNISPIAGQTTGHGVTTRYPLSVISRRSPSIPLPLLSPAAAAGFLQRIPPMHLLSQGPGSPHGEGHFGGVITSVPSPHTSPQSHEQSTLAMLRAKIAAGHPVYSRGYRSDRQQSSNLFSMSRFPSAALGSATQIAQHEGVAGPSSLFSSSAMSPHLHHQHQTQQAMARPKTKAIRSSQVPQSARYTAAEVDAMVDKVQNFPGNMVPCAICSKFVKRERLRAHIHECHLLHGKRIICPHCGIGLKSKGSYRVHLWRHKRGALPSTRQRHSEPGPGT